MCSVGLFYTSCSAAQQYIRSRNTPGLPEPRPEPPQPPPGSALHHPTTFKAQVLLRPFPQSPCIVQPRYQYVLCITSHPKATYTCLPLYLVSLSQLLHNQLRHIAPSLQHLTHTYAFTAQVGFALILLLFVSQSSAHECVGLFPTLPRQRQVNAPELCVSWTLGCSSRVELPIAT